MLYVIYLFDLDLYFYNHFWSKKTPQYWEDATPEINGPIIGNNHYL